MAIAFRPRSVAPVRTRKFVVAHVISIRRRISRALHLQLRSSIVSADRICGRAFPRRSIRALAPIGGRTASGFVEGSSSGVNLGLREDSNRSIFRQCRSRRAQQDLYSMAAIIPKNVVGRSQLCTTCDWPQFAYLPVPDDSRSKFGGPHKTAPWLETWLRLMSLRRVASLVKSFLFRPGSCADGGHNDACQRRAAGTVLRWLMATKWLNCMWIRSRSES